MRDGLAPSSVHIDVDGTHQQTLNNQTTAADAIEMTTAEPTTQHQTLSAEQAVDHVIQMEGLPNNTSNNETETQQEQQQQSTTPQSTPQLKRRLSERLNFVPEAHHEPSEEELDLLQEQGGEDNPAASAPIQLISYKNLIDRLQTKIDVAHPKHSVGLTAEEAAERLARNGPNRLTPPPELPEILKYLSHYLDPFMILLVIAGTLSMITVALPGGPFINLWVGVALFTVVIISSTFGYIQSGKASAVMKSFKNMLPRQAHVIRDGRIQDVPAADLVVGDIVRVGTGDQCPTDLRLIYVNELKVEVSSLTGESVPITASTVSRESKLEEAHNVCFNTSQCLEGEALGVVFATGDATLIGRIAKMASHTGGSETPIQVEVRLFVKNLTIFSVLMGLIFFIVGIARGQPWISAFINGFIGVLVANVPEGLPATVVSCLTITAKRLAELNVFVKELNSVETLGSCTIIASDKTGTLTQNKMSVSRLWFDLTPMTIETAMRDLGPSQLTVKANAVSSGPGATLRCLERVAAVCSRTRFEDQRDLTDEEAQAIEQQHIIKSLDPTMTLRSAKAAFPEFLSLLDNNMTLNTAKRQAFTSTRDDSKRKVIGDASETALFNYIRARHSVELIRYHNRMIFEVPFNSRNKYALTIMKPFNIKGNTDHRRVLLMKGAPEVIVAKCSHYMSRGRVFSIDDEFKLNFHLAYETFGSFGERVLGFAHLELPLDQYPPEMDTQYSLEKQNFPTTGLVFLGLVSLVDPPKESVPGAIAQCRSAGIRVVMVTGDHPLTAAAIARQVGIFTLNTRDELAKINNCYMEEVAEEDVQAVVVKGTELERFSEEDWDYICSKAEIVFARTTPQQKLEIVSHFQRLGNIVAATGDGVNDSPALKKADIGVAMGISGSDVARDAGDVILMDDDFSSIVVGVREGRTIFDNLTKTVAYTLTHMAPEVTGILLNLAIGYPLSLSVILILCIDVGTELGPSIALAYEKSESDVMNRPPRNAKTDHLVTAKVIFYCWCVAGAIETLVCFLNFFLVFAYYGINSNELAFAADHHFDPSQDDTVDHAWTLKNGQSLLPSQQNDILLQAQTAYWVTLTGCQVFHITQCKTRVMSIFQHGLLANSHMNFGMLLEITLILIIVFVPAHAFFQTQIFPGQYWAVVLIGWAALFVAGEGRKYFGRKYANENRYVKFLMW